MSFWQIFFLVLIITFSGFTQGLSGFASILVALPLLTLFINIKTVVPFMNLLCLCMNFYLLLQLRQHIPWKKLSVLLISSIPGIFIGAYLLKNILTSYLQILLGIVCVLFSLYNLFWKSNKREIDFRWEYLVGFLAGFLQGSLGANGPPLVIYLTIQPWRKNTIKAIFASFFFLHNVITGIFYAGMGLITSNVVYYFLISIPIMVLGTVLGHLYYQKISEVLYRKIITYLLFLAGILTLYKAFA